MCRAAYDRRPLRTALSAVRDAAAGKAAFAFGDLSEATASVVGGAVGVSMEHWAAERGEGGESRSPQQGPNDTNELAIRSDDDEGVDEGAGVRRGGAIPKA
jgi:hypothetical protein